MRRVAQKSTTKKRSIARQRRRRPSRSLAPRKSRTKRHTSIRGGITPVLFVTDQNMFSRYIQFKTILNGKNVYGVNSTITDDDPNGPHQQCPFFFADNNYSIIFLKQVGTYVALMRRRVPKLEKLLKQLAANGLDVRNITMNDAKMNRLVYLLNKPSETDTTEASTSDTRTAIFMDTENCMKTMGDLRPAQHVIRELNEQLARRCPSLRLDLNYVYNLHGAVTAFTNSPVLNGEDFYMNSLILCLTDQESGCVSSVEVVDEEDNNSFYINSATDSGFQRFSFNKLVRAVVIIVAPFIKNMAFLNSFAINPLSSWAILGYYSDVRVDDHNIQQLIDTHQTQKEVLFPELKKKQTLRIKVPLNKANQRAARLVFEDCLKDICRYVESGPRRPTRLDPSELATHVPEMLIPHR